MVSTAAVDLDHTSFAVRDATAWARLLRRELGATPIAGEALPAFRYLLLYVGTADTGARMELIESAGQGFLARFLDRRGEGPHHITFTVPDLRASVEQVRALGAAITGEDYSHASWQEAFIAPDGVHGVVLQLAQSDATYPTPAELLRTRERDTATFPASAGASDPTWWTPVWDTPAGPLAQLGATHLATTDLDWSRRLFDGVLGGHARELEGGLTFHWPSGTVQVHSAAEPGITAVSLYGGPPGGLKIGSTPLQPTTKGPDG